MTGFVCGRRPTTGELNDIFAVQEEIARAVAGSLKVALLGEQGATPPSQRHERRSLQRLSAGAGLPRAAQPGKHGQGARLLRAGHQAGLRAMPRHGWGWQWPTTVKRYFGYAPFADALPEGAGRAAEQARWRSIAAWQVAYVGIGPRPDGLRF